MTKFQLILMLVGLLASACAPSDHLNLSAQDLRMPAGGFRLRHLAYPRTQADVEALIENIEHSVYAPVVAQWRARGRALNRSEIEKLWRMNRKAEWRETDGESAQRSPERRMKLITQKNWRAFQWGGEEDSADPAAPFAINETDPRPAGMPAGTYSLSSGTRAFVYPSKLAMLRNENPIPFEIEFQQVTREGTLVIQNSGNSEAEESLGWDGRMEYQPNGRGGFEIVITQGAMELPRNLIGAASNAPLAPRVNGYNEFRSRHLFQLKEWIPSQGSRRPKLIVRDEGSILDFNPTTECRYIQMYPSGKLRHAHGYGENFFPNASDMRKPWLDEKGYFWRVFDMVTQETTIREKQADGSFRDRYIPTETNSVAAKMDPRNPSKLAKGENFVFITSNQIPGTRMPLPASVRYAYQTSGPAVEVRSVLENGTVHSEQRSVPQNAPALLNEGLNFAESSVKVNGRNYFLGTNSAGEYASGGLPSAGQKFYGTYLWYRTQHEGRIGPYHLVLNANHTDARDMFREITQMYGASWGIGRAQILGKQEEGLWSLAHMIDVDVLPEDRTRFPLFGYPGSAQMTNTYRRHQILIPTRVVDAGGEPVLEVDDPEVQADLIDWRSRRNLN